MMIGLSLSFCIQDIMAGKVPETEVSKIVTMTCVRTDAEWDTLLDAYKQVHWRTDAFEAAAAVELVQRLRAQGKIEQPRLDDPEHEHSIDIGHWIMEPVEQKPMIYVEPYQ